MTSNTTECVEWRPRSGDTPRYGDIALILAAIAIVISIGVHAPGHSYCYAQMRQMGATVGMIESGNWILPHNHEGRLARKPQLYSWLTAPVLLATGIYSDFTFRWVSTASAFGCGVLAYLLGLAWFGRRTGLIGALLWAVSLHMGKLMYLGTTDMLNTFWLMLAILCADRLLLAAPDRSGDRRWAIGLWFSIIMGAMSKGWGIANLPLIGGWIAMTTGLAPGFKAVAPVEAAEPGLGPKLRKYCIRGWRIIALIRQRWWTAIKRVRLFWGLLALAAVIVPVGAAMYYVGGDEFERVIHREIWKRMFGGHNAPKPSSAPTLMWLLFYTLPSSALVIGAVSFTRFRKLLAPESATARPLWWIIAVALPFSLAHGFRPDYLLPCYVSVTILGASGVDRLMSMNPKDSKKASILRHLYAFVVISACVFVVGTPLLYLCHEHLPEFMRRAVRMPQCVAPETWRILSAIAPLGLGLIIAAVWASLRWRIGTLTAILITAMLCVLFVDRHMISRHARTGDGETMIRFADAAGRVVGNDKFAVCQGEKMGAELYWGRFGTRVTEPADIESLDDDVQWLVTCDKGLVQLGAFAANPEGRYVANINGAEIRVEPDPSKLGSAAELNVNNCITEKNMGKPRLVRLRR